MSRNLIKKIYTNKWHNGNHNNFSLDDVLSMVGQKISTHEIHVGSDSNPSKFPQTLAVTIALIKPHRGGNYFWTKIKLPNNRKINLHERLYCEAEISCNIASKIKERYPNTHVTVHLDINSSTGFASGKYAQQLVKFVRAFGFLAVIKPLSWAASSIADKHAD